MQVVRRTISKNHTAEAVVKGAGQTGSVPGLFFNVKIFMSGMKVKERVYELYLK
jgi:hypothetical protein